MAGRRRGFPCHKRAAAIRRLAAQARGRHKGAGFSFENAGMNEAIYSLMGAGLGAFLFIFAGREPLRRLIGTLKDR